MMRDIFEKGVKTMAVVSGRRNALAAKKIAQIKVSLDSIIADMARDPAAFVATPDKDFTRNRVFTFEKMIKIILGMGGNSIQKELSDYFDTTNDFATKSAFVQQRGKLLPEAFKHLLLRFNESCQDDKTYMGYYLYACDGTMINVAKNLTNQETHVNGSNGSEGFNQYHISALYDLLNKNYADAIIKGVNFINEPQAAASMINTLDLRGKTILIGDRGYAALNLMEHCNRKDGLEFLIRVKEDWITEVKALPMAELDTEVSFELRTTQTYADKAAYRNGTAKYASGKSKFGKYKVSQTWDFESPHKMKIRIVRFRITEDRYETIATSLDKDRFPAERIKELYNMRWGIETSFRELKYAIGLVNFHARKDSSIMQEIYASLVMYNFSERITACAVVVQAHENKYVYQVNFTMSAYVCRRFYWKRRKTPFLLLGEITRYIEPIRKGRTAKRKVKSKTAVNFIYRVA